MTYYFDDIAKYLQEQGIGTLATDIFIGDIRTDLDEVVVISPTGGYSQNLRLNDTKYTFQIFVRSVSFIGGYKKIHDIFNLLDDGDRLRKVTPPSGKNMLVKAMQPPFSLGKDEQNRHEFAFNVLLITSRD